MRQRTARVKLKAPFNTHLRAAFLAVSLPPTNELRVGCGFGLTCEFDGEGITPESGGKKWRPYRLSLHAPGVFGDDVSQSQALEGLVKTASNRQARIIATYKASADDNDIEAIRVVLRIDSMNRQ